MQVIGPRIVSQWRQAPVPRFPFGAPRDAFYRARSTLPEKGSQFQALNARLFADMAAGTLNPLPRIFANHAETVNALRSNRESQFFPLPLSRSLPSSPSS